VQQLLLLLLLQVLRRLLPMSVDVPTAFETVGHMAHLNLREQHIPFKHLIGQVLS